MNLKILGMAAISLALLSGSVMAQESAEKPAGVDSSAASGNSASGTTMRSDFTSDTEKSWYAENGTWLGGFFTDGTMSTMKTDDEVKQIFAAMGATDQAGMKAACAKAVGDRGSYGSITIGLCSAAGVI